MRLTKLGDLDVRVTGGSDGEGAGDGPVVVLLHGFGAPGDDLVPIGRALKAPRDTRFVFPEAPLSLGGAAAGGRAWWWIDLEERIRRRAAQDTDVSEVPSGLHDARAKIERLLVATERALHPPPGKIVLGGFSQGAMLSLDVALASNATLAGILLMSGSHIAAKEWAARFETRRGLPVFMSHGQDDIILPFGVSRSLSETLTAHGLNVVWMPFRGGHGIPPEVLAAAGSFLVRVLA